MEAQCVLCEVRTESLYVEQSVLVFTVNTASDPPVSATAALPSRHPPRTLPAICSRPFTVLPRALPCFSCLPPPPLTGGMPLVLINFTKMWSRAARGARHQDRLTVTHNVALTIREFVLRLAVLLVKND
jgi:hypothetical protein